METRCRWPTALRLDRASGGMHPGCLADEEVVMANGDTPQSDPERDNVPADSTGVPAHGTLQPAESPAPSALDPQGVDGDSQAMTSSSSPRPGRLKHLAEGRTGVWAAVAVLCVSVGIVGSVLGAHAVARSDAANAGQAYPRTSA